MSSASGGNFGGSCGDGNRATVMHFGLDDDTEDSDSPDIDIYYGPEFSVEFG